MQAQIAFANTALTVLGVWLLKIPGIGLLGLFVFICSFIPIAGVFISTVPIAFVALTEYGFIKVSRDSLKFVMLCTPMTLTEHSSMKNNCLAVHLGSANGLCGSHRVWLHQGKHIH